MDYQYKPYYVVDEVAVFNDDSTVQIEQFTNVLDKCNTLIFKDFDEDMMVMGSKKYFNDPNFSIRPNIAHLRLGYNFNQCGHNWVTKNLMCVYIGDLFNKQIILPKNMLFFEINGDISQTVLSKRLKYLRSDIWYKHVLKHLPKPLTFLCVYDDTFFQPCLSKNLLYVMVDINCNKLMLLPKNVRRLKLSLCFANGSQTLKRVKCWDVDYNVEKCIDGMETVTDIYFHAHCSIYHLVDNLPNSVKRIFYKRYYLYNNYGIDDYLYEKMYRPVLHNRPSNAVLIWNNFETDYETLIHECTVVNDIKDNCVCTNHWFF